MALIDKIANSHYVPLEPPYPVIYSNNEVGIQIATLIVVTEPQASPHVGNRNVYRVATHSHPVVVYGNKHLGISEASNIPGDYAEGEVWDRVDISNVSVIAFVNDRGIISPSDEVLLQRIDDMVLKGRLNNMFYDIPFNLSKIVYRLQLSGVYLPKQDSINGRVRLVWGGSTKPNKHSITSNNIMNLPAFFLAAEWDEVDNTEKELIRQIDEYIAAFSANNNTTVNIEFWTETDILQELAKRLTKKYTTSK